MADANLERTRLCGDYIATWNIRDLWNPWDIVSTLPADTDQEKLVVLSLIQADAVPLESLLGKTFELRHYIVHEAKVTQISTGRQYAETRIVFPRYDALPVDSLSLSVIKGIGEFVELSGRWPPWDPPLEVMVHRRQLKKSCKYNLKYIR